VEALVADPDTERRVDLTCFAAAGAAGEARIGTADGRFAGIHGSTRDISERVRLRELRQKAES
jgi:hypothetical protein